MAMDLLCQEMRDACWVGPESLGFPCFTEFTVRSSLLELSQQPFSHRGRAVTTKERDVVRTEEGKTGPS